MNDVFVPKSEYPNLLEIRAPLKPPEVWFQSILDAHREEHAYTGNISLKTIKTEVAGY